MLVGATPVFVDVEPDTFCIDPALVEAAITPRTRALLPVHLYGHPAQMPEFAEIARRRGLLVIEDAAQAHGAIVNGKKVGALGNTAVFSLYPTKNITSGEGGLVTTDDDRIATSVRLLRQHGQGQQRYIHEVLGYNFRMTDICAAIGLVQLRRLEEFNAARRLNAQGLTEALGGIAEVVPPVERAGYGHVFHQYTVRVKKGRDSLAGVLAEREIGCGVYYPVPLHHQPVYRDRGYGGLSFPVSERLAHEVLSLPVHPALEADDIGRIARTVREELTQ